MSILFKHIEPTYRLGVWKMDESYETLCNKLHNPILRQEAEQRFTAPHRRQEWLSVRLLLQELSGEQLTISYLPSGKPYLSNSQLHISISHTKGYVAVVIGTNEVGIDIEQYGQRVHRVAKKFIRTDEIIVPYKGENTWSLLLHWSAKEVLFKCMNTSEVDFRKHLHILPFTPQQEGKFEAHEYKTEQQRTYTIHYLLHSDFVLCYLI